MVKADIVREKRKAKRPGLGSIASTDPSRVWSPIPDVPPSGGDLLPGGDVRLLLLPCWFFSWKGI